MPQNCEEDAPILPYTISNEHRKNLNNIIPENPNQPYDIKEVINEITDKDSFFEVHKNYAENIVCGFARMAGKSIGVVANQPAFLAGVLNIEASTKGARFVRFCDCFNIPLLILEDVPGFYLEPIRSGMESLLMVPNYYTHFLKPLFLELLSLRVKHMVVHMM